MADSRYWSKYFIAHSIEVYKSNTCLWKIKSKKYTNKNLKNLANDKLVEICKPVNPDANEDYVIKKIQSFRGSFRKEIKKVLASKRSGAGQEDVYIPMLWYYNLLLFTIDQETPTASISNMNNEEVEELEEMEYGGENESEILEITTGEKSQEALDLVEKNEGNVEKSLLTQISERTTDASVTKSVITIPKMKSVNSTGKQKGKTSVNKRTSDFLEFCKNQLQTNNDIGEYDAVRISWAKKMKRMDPTKAILAEALINKIITKGLLKKICLMKMDNDRGQVLRTVNILYCQILLISNGKLHRQIWQNSQLRSSWHRPQT